MGIGESGGYPPQAAGIPPAVAAAAAGRPVTVVWHNRLGGLTCEVGTGPDRRFVKWLPAGSGTDLGREAARLRWAAPFTPVPRLIGQGRDEAGSWLVTEALPGHNAASGKWKAQPRTAVRAIGEGLRAMHESLPAGSCPFSWSAPDRLAELRRQLDDGRLDPAWWPSPGPPLRTGRALDLLAEPPPVDRLVVCHGDSCAPNTLLTDDGRWSAHVDLGDLGLADRWADLAIATWNVTLNYGPGWESLLLDAYGVAPDEERSRYYRLLGRCY
jgi:aminoglycoside phosphotransferase